MCELLGISSRRPATVGFSLQRFAEHGGHTGPHRDGWGLATFEGRDVRLIKEAEAAADSAWVEFLTTHEVASRLTQAHIRHASRGGRSYANSQPFTREAGGRMHVFAHNGDLPGLDETFSLTSFHPVGETDSEYAFCALMDRVRALWAGTTPSLEARLDLVTAFAATLRARGPANFLYADGEVLFAHGHRRRQPQSGVIAPPGLTTLTRRCHEGRRFETDGLTVGGPEQAVVLVASVPLTDEDWRPLGEGEVIAIADGAIVARRPAAAA